MKRERAGIGSCWRYVPEDRTVYAGQLFVVLDAYTDALGDHEYEVLVTPSMRVYDVLDCDLEKRFECIASAE